MYGWLGILYESMDEPLAMTHPANILPPEYDDIQPRDYDPEFTADISTKMRIPDKLGVSEGFSGDGIQIGYPISMHQSAHMNVPDRILVAGQEQHIGMREDLKMGNDFTPGVAGEQYVGLSTPPRTLTLDERPFPQVNDPASEARKAAMLAAQNGYIPVTPRMDRRSSLELIRTPGDGLLLQDDDEDDVMIMRRQIAKLAHHVARLEEDNSRRALREKFLYPLVMGYIIFQMAKWFLRNS